MIQYALICDRGHNFESWFPDSAAYDKQAKRGLVSCPLWAIYGQEDAVYRDSWPEVSAAWQAYPNLRGLVMVPDAGHWVQYEEPHRVNALLLHALGD